MRHTENRRKRRTRTALIDAFNHLILKGNTPKLRVADVVERADIGRSTFYEHYAGIDDIHLQALARPLAILADAAAGRGDSMQLTRLLEHFWENRARARMTFGGDLRDKVTRMLAEMVVERMPEAPRGDGIPRHLASLQRVEATLAPIRGWLLGEASCEAAALAAWICSSREISGEV